jgi:hypothetical protein
VANLEAEAQSGALLVATLLALAAAAVLAAAEVLATLADQVLAARVATYTRHEGEENEGLIVTRQMQKLTAYRERSPVILVIVSIRERNSTNRSE